MVFLIYINNYKTLNKLPLFDFTLASFLLQSYRLLEKTGIKFRGHITGHFHHPTMGLRSPTKNAGFRNDFVSQHAQQL
jgi:hypothetical protein